METYFSACFSVEKLSVCALVSFSFFFHFILVSSQKNTKVRSQLNHKTPRVRGLLFSSSCQIRQILFAFSCSKAVTHPFCLQVLPCLLLLKFSGFCFKQWKCKDLVHCGVTGKTDFHFFPVINYLILHLRNFASYFYEL